MTLTEAAFWTKRLSIVVGVAGVILLILILILTSIAKDPLPPEYLTANYACTDTKEEFLESRLEIPSLKVNSDSENVFELQTDTGKVNNLSSLEIINVHKYKVKEQQLDNQLKAKEIASALGFDADKIYRKGTTDYIWTSSNNSRSLDINATTLNFVMTTSSSYIRDVAKASDLPTVNEAISYAKNTVRRLGILGSDYNYNDSGNINTFLIDINPDGTFSEAPSLAEAELIKVDFQKSRPMISIKESTENSTAVIRALNDNLGDPEEEEIIINDSRVKVYNYSTIVTYPNPSSSNISVYIGPDDEKTDILPNVYKMDFTYWPLETESCGTYELVSPTYALEKVQSGEGSLVYLNEKNGDEIEDYQPRSVNKYIIYNIDVAYYEPIATQPLFLQPIYVISGEAVFKNDTRGEFHIFYPAINYDIVQDKIETTQDTTTEDDSGGGLLNL
jgi:hypothetical protein